jgi:hypothetical protein
MSSHEGDVVPRLSQPLSAEERGLFGASGDTGQTWVVKCDGYHGG